MSGIIHFIQNHTAHAAPILIAGGFAIAIFLERFRALFLVFPMHSTGRFFEKLTALVMADRISEAVALCERYRTKPVASVAKEALLRAHQPETLIEHGLELAVGEMSSRISRRTAFLATIANVATLLGLFGTIVGLIQSFAAVADADPQTKAALLSAGISTAMNATMLGLAVAIPSLVTFSILTNKANRLLIDVEQSAVRALDMLKQRYYSTDQNNRYRSA